jgi:hypothetical protein
VKLVRRAMAHHISLGCIIEDRVRSAEQGHSVLGFYPNER